MENTAKLYVPCIDFTSAHEVTEEFTLPDYMPAVQRIVSCRAQVLPESRAVRDGEAILSGIVSYTVLYIGEEGGLCCAPLNSEYTARISCRSEYDVRPEELSVRTHAESVQCRATAPRRLSVTCRMRSALFGNVMSEVSEKLVCASDEHSVTPADAINTERRRREKTCCAMTFASFTGGTSGELREREDVKILACDGSAGVSDVKLDGGAAIVRGELYISCLIMNGDGVYSSVRSKAPFEERVPVSLTGGISDDCRHSATAVARCASVSVSGGEDGMFKWEAEYDIDVTAVTAYSCTVTDDAYSTEYETETETVERTALTDVKASSTRMSVSSSKQVNGEGRSVAASFGKAVCESCEYDGERAVFTGACTVGAVLVGEGDAVLEEVTVPFSYKCDTDASDVSAMSGAATASVLYTDARLDGDRLVCDAEITVEVITYGRSATNALSRIILHKEAPVDRSKSRITVYFPYGDETEWDIGKKYHCEEKCISHSDGGRAVVIQR